MYLNVEQKTYFKNKLDKYHLKQFNLQYAT